MDRRQLLARFGAVLGTASLGGCLSRYRDVAGEVGDGDETTTEGTTTERTTMDDTDTDETTTDEGTATGGTTAEGTVTGAVDSANWTFAVTDRGCGEPASEANVEFDAADASVAVTGTIGGSDACHTAELADASYDSGTGALDLTVVSKREAGAEMCAQCLVAIDYEATFAFAGDPPETVTVTHEAMGESATVTTAESG